MSREIVVPAGEVISRPKRGGLYMWAVAALVGALVALVIVVLHGLIAYGQFIAYGASPGRLASRLVDMPWWNRLIAPMVGGSLICLLLRLGISVGWGASPRTFGLQDVVQHRRLRGTIRATTLTLRDGFLSAITAVVSLAWGGSAGREEPAAHLGATVAVLHGRLLGLDVASRRLLVGMGVAAAIGASLHAPIAGVFLARELILRRQRLSALGPVAIAAATGWLVSMWLMGGRPAIVIPSPGVVPAQAHLAAIVALPVLIAAAYACNVAWTRAPILAAKTAARLRIPLWLLPLPGGLALGVIALAFPQVLGIGYEPLASGLNGNYGAELLPVLALAKIAATGVTFAFRWGGGAVSPSLYVGAMLGAALGAVAGLVLGIPAPQAFMGLVGMAVCFAVLSDSPFAATILVLELSGSTAVGATSLFCCFVACMVARRLAPLPADETSQTLRWR
jgi:CIC family chloride channel protein